MPGLVEKAAAADTFKTINVKELHPTFGAEIEGVDFPHPSDEQFEEILKAMAKACTGATACIKRGLTCHSTGCVSSETLEWTILRMWTSRGSSGTWTTSGHT
jgi:hypothetical protein